MKKLVGEMSDLLNKIVKFSDDYADVKDIFLNDSTMELAEDAIGSLKFLNNSRKALSIIKFKYFLKGLNYENADKESIEKLIRYVDNQSKAEFITNSFDKIISSNSKLACCVMGLMLNDIGQHNDDISQEDLIMLNALPMLNDFDIKNFHYLYKIIYVFLTIFLYLLKCPQSLILSALRAFCFCGKPHISRSIFLYFRYQAWLKSW